MAGIRRSVAKFLMPFTIQIAKYKSSGNCLTAALASVSQIFPEKVPLIEAEKRGCK